MTYILNDSMNLKQLNIYYKAIHSVYSYQNQYAILLDDSHICFMPTEEETKKIIRNINLNIAIKFIEYFEESKNITPKITYANSTYERASVTADGKDFTCDIVQVKDIRIDGTALLNNKKLIKQFYAKANKKGKKYEALDFNFEELDPRLVNDIATLVLGIPRLHSSAIASFKNYQEMYKDAITDFLEFEQNKDGDNKEYKINNDFVDCILQTEKAFREANPIRKNVVLHKSANGILKKLKVGDDFKRTSFITAYFTEREENFQNVVFYHIVIPRGTPFAMVSQLFNQEECLENENAVLLLPSNFEVKSIENEKNTRKTDIKLKYTEEIQIKDLLVKAFKTNLENYVKVNSNSKKSRDQYEKTKFKYKSFFEENSAQSDLFKEINLIPEQSLTYLLDEIEDIDYDKELFEHEGDYGISHTKRLMLLCAIVSRLNGFSTEDTKIMLAAAKYHDIGITADEDLPHGRQSSQKITSELDEFSEQDRDLIRFLIAEHDLPAKQREEDLKNVQAGKKIKFTKMLKVFVDMIELEKVRNYKCDPTLINNKYAKKMVKIAYDNWNMFDTLFSYLLAEYFAISRLEDIKTIDMIEEQERENKKAFALINVGSNKNSLLSKAMSFFDKIRANVKTDNIEENSAAAAKARLSKVMVGRQIAKAAEAKELSNNDK